MAKKHGWLRLYVEVLNDPKVQNLSGKLFKIWINLLIIAKGNDPKNGTLPSSIDEISFALRQPRSEVKKSIEALISAGLIENNTMHNWAERQYESDADRTNAERQQRYRNALRNGRVTDDVTPPRYRYTDTDTDTDTEERDKEKKIQKKERPNSLKKVIVGKSTFGTFGRVSLTDSDYQSLQVKFGQAQRDRIIEKLDSYKEATGKTYKSDMGAIRQWVIESVGAKPLEPVAITPTRLPTDEEREYAEMQKRGGLEFAEYRARRARELRERREQING